ncbi:MAG: arylesterase [Gammaproteobacteria bacterium]|nr:MAG: arylesterase [Gammaproteobacteria bacterium]
MLFRLFPTILFLLAGVIMPVSAQPAPVILIFGDSLSAGYGIERDQAWPQLLPERLHAYGYDYTVVNASISGETTVGGVTRLPKTLKKYQPEILLLGLGANDGLRGLPLDAMYTHLQNMIQQAIEADTSVLLIGMRLPSNYGPVYTDAFHGQFTQLANNNPVRFLSFLLDGIALDTTLFQEDGLHPTARAQPMILENVWKELQPMLKKSGA